MNKYFDPFILVSICINIIFYMLKFHRQPEYLDLLVDYINLFFLFIFIMEAFLKLFALGFKYFLHPWNNFDFAILILTILSQLAE